MVVAVEIVALKTAVPAAGLYQPFVGYIQRIVFNLDFPMAMGAERRRVQGDPDTQVFPVAGHALVDRHLAPDFLEAGFQKAIDRMPVGGIFVAVQADSVVHRHRTELHSFLIVKQLPDFSLNLLADGARSPAMAVLAGQEVVPGIHWPLGQFLFVQEDRYPYQ